MKSLEALRALGTGGEAPADAKQRVQAALMASIAASTAATAAAVASQSAALSSAPTAGSPLLAGLTSAKALAVAAGIWVMGGATGAALYGALRTQEVRVVYVDRPVLPISVTAPPAAVSPVVPAPTSTPSAPMPAAIEPGTRHAAPAATAQGSDLARERALLDLARAAASRGEPALALAQTERHRAQFPRAKLAEEREALAIRALLSLGRASEARTRAEAFHLAYPNSLLAPAIDSALSVP
ncbi:MAG TPA: hypothetical protein VER96_00220 [Polyangiaceae bacterium]|nr:hypothetical protein [Polyangiaceae bacterium]